MRSAIGSKRSHPVLEDALSQVLLPPPKGRSRYDRPQHYNFLTVIFRFLFYLQPAIGCIFIWSVGTAIKEPGLEDSARGTTQLCLGTMFMLICFHLLSLCGATPVMVTVLRVFYGVWFGFSVLLIAQYALLIMRCRTVLYEKIYPKNELQD